MLISSLGYYHLFVNIQSEVHSCISYNYHSAHANEKEVTCGSSKIEVRLDKKFLESKSLRIKTIDQLTMSKNSTNCIPTFDQASQSYRFIIFAPFKMCNTEVLHETEGKLIHFLFQNDVLMASRLDE